MDIHKAIDLVSSKFEYEIDPKYIFDVWKIMGLQHGTFKGDCEDFSLTVIWYANDCNFFKFIFNTVFLSKYKMHQVKTFTGENHAVGSYGDYFFDNWTLKALYKLDFFKSTRHEYDYKYFLPLKLFSFITGYWYKMIKGI